VAGALDVKDYIATIEAAGFTHIELNPVYFDQETVDEYVKIADGGSCCQPKPKLVINDGVEVKVIELDEEVDLGGKPVREAIFSAKITAYKP
jgi:hypothetical protein